MIEAFVLIRVRPARLEESSNIMQAVKENLLKVEGVREVRGVFGRFDFVAILEAETPEKLGSLVSDNIRGIRGIAETETLIAGF